MQMRPFSAAPAPRPSIHPPASMLPNPPPNTIRVSNVPQFVDQPELSRVFAPCPGLLAARLLGGGNALVSFQDPASAASCKNLYDRWAGWGAPLVCELLDASAGPGAMGAGAKRPREEDQFGGPSAAGYNLYDPVEQFSKQQRTGPIGGAGMSPQQFLGGAAGPNNAMPAGAPTSRPPMGLSSVMPPDMMPGQPIASSMPMAAQPQPQQPAPQQPQPQPQPVGSAGLAAALANLNPTQLSSLAGLLGQAVASSAAPQATSLPIQQPPGQLPLSAPAPAASQAPGGQFMQPMAGGMQPAPAHLYNPAAQPAPQQVVASQPPFHFMGASAQHQPLAQQPPNTLFGAPPGQPAYAPMQPQPQPQAPIILQGSAPMMGQPIQLAPQPAPQQPLMNAHGPQPHTVPPYGAPEPGAHMPPQERFPPNASSTLYIDGIPLDMTPREAEHIFRPFPGFQDLRLISKENPNRPGERNVKMFVDFVDIPEAANAMEVLQGYRIDRKDENSPVLRPVFGRPQMNRGDRRGPPPERGAGYGSSRDPYSRGGPPSRRGDYAGPSRTSETPGAYRRGERGPPPDRDAPPRDRAPAPDRRRSRW